MVPVERRDLDAGEHPAQDGDAALRLGARPDRDEPRGQQEPRRRGPGPRREGQVQRLARHEHGLVRLGPGRERRHEVQPLGAGARDVDVEGPGLGEPLPRIRCQGHVLQHGDGVGHEQGQVQLVVREHAVVDVQVDVVGGRGRDVQATCALRNGHREDLDRGVVGERHRASGTGGVDLGEVSGRDGREDGAEQQEKQGEGAGGAHRWSLARAGPAEDPGSVPRVEWIRRPGRRADRPRRRPRRRRHRSASRARSRT